MNLAFLKTVPWREIIDWTPAVVAMVANKRRPPASDDTGHIDAGFSELRERVDAVEASQRAQVEVVAQIGERGEKLAQAVQVLSARVVLLAWLSGASLLISLTLAVYVLFR